VREQADKSREEPARDRAPRPLLVCPQARRAGSGSMFWRLGFAQSSPIETLLDSDDYTLQQLLDEDDLVQECKQINNKLLDLYASLPI
jgi:hypothetical protein